MKNKKFLLNTILALVLATILLVCLIVRIVLPAAIFMKFDIPMIVAISLVALVIEYYLAPGQKRCYLCTGILAAITFGLLPYASSLVAFGDAWKIGIVGGIVFVIVTALFSSIQERLSSGVKSKVAPILSAVVLYLAFQCFAGIIL